MSNTHSFSTDIAKQYGINEAIILQHLYYWFQKNRANDKHFYDDTWWTYNSTNAFCEIFPYFTARQIQYTIQTLKNEGLIITGNYNSSKFDKTLWYSFTKKGLTLFENTILQNCQTEVTKKVNGVNEIVKPIPDINTNINTDIKKINKKESQLVLIPEVLPDNISLEIWRKWIEYKIAIKKSYKTQVGVNGAIMELSNMVNSGQSTAEEIINHSIGREYQGFYQPQKQQIYKSNQKQYEHRADKNTIIDNPIERERLNKLAEEGRKLLNFD